MRMSRMFIPTLREDPAEAELVSHKYLLRGGYIRKLTAGVYIYLPLMQRVLAKISNIVREEMNRSGALEITMPVLCPAEIWQQTGRWDAMGPELMRAEDRHNRPMVLGPTHEEVVTSLVCGEVRSYRQVPLNLYQIQVKFRDEIRPRFGLMRGREFIMKDAYSFDVDQAGLDVAYQKMVDAYVAIFKRCGLETVMVESDTGAMGGKFAHEFMVVVDTDGGEAIILTCPSCGYGANIERAESRSLTPPPAKEAQRSRLLVDTPDARTIEEVTAFLKLPPQRLVKTLLYRAGDRTVAALIRGDREINEVKLANAVGATGIEMLDAESVMALTKAPVGFAGPIGLSKDVLIVADEEVHDLTNFVVGANQADKHYVDVNLADFRIDKTALIRSAQEGEGCPRCVEGRLVKRRGIEVGNTFKLGTKYSVALGATFTDAEGNEKPFIMGSYGIGVTRTAQAAIERFHDDKGIIWPMPIAPFHAHIVCAKSDDPALVKAADDLYNDLVNAGVEALYDDRGERAGVKFADADLIGVPLRITVGAKGLAKGAWELKRRDAQSAEDVPFADVVNRVKREIGL
jgi:prolyl-tRNA synthetase